ncbi:MAG: HAD family hydrolase [Candidatus Sumerlaeia bacterium]|nr:HAD family hydrolase [Candidatus Sumerlaeia bacterium]
MSGLDHLDVLLLDLNGTFMFGHDRFGPGESFAATYRRLGGSRLRADVVDHLVRATFESVLRRYNDPAHTDSFPSLAEMLAPLCAHAGVCEEESHLLARVFALHECGHVPPEHAVALHRLARTHRLGLISDIWSPKELFLAELDRAGVADLFEVLVFSSDTTSVKPSAALFERALEAFPDVPRERIAYVGDNFARDVLGARTAGLCTIWVSASEPPNGHHPPDLRVATLLELCPCR